MRFIHTSDWHLGRSFGPVSLHDDQAAFCDWFVDLARAEAVDLVVIAGDLYDRAIAPTESIELFRDTVGRLLAAGVVVAAITGNHDSADRVAAYDTMLDGAGLYLRGGHGPAGTVLTRTFDDGDVDLVLVPFLEPRTAPDQDPRPTHESVVAAATTAARSALVSPRSIVVSHAFVTGGTTTGSERQLSVGGTAEVAAGVYAGFDYVALGHLHRPQDVTRPGEEPAGSMRYSGTPLAYSFSEEHDKSVTLVDMDPTGGTERRIVEIPLGRRVARLTGTIDELLGDPRHEAHTDHFVQATLTDTATVLHAKARLSVRFPHVIEVRQRPVGVDDAAQGAPADLHARAPIDVVREFWAETQGSAPPDALDALLIDAVTDVFAEAGS